MNYPNSDRQVPPNVALAIEFAGKTGILSKRLWETRFNFGCNTWKIRQFNKLLQKDIFKPYVQIDKNQFYKLGTAGQVLSRKLEIKPVRAPLNNQIVHDEWIFETVIALHQAGYVYDWLSEAQLKTGANFKDERWQICSKIPDAVLKMNVKGDIRNIAFEYERTLKAVWRIKESLRAYSGSIQFPLVIYICEDEVIRQSYFKILKRLNDTSLSKKIGLTLVGDWHMAPEIQPIQMMERTFCLKDILRTIGEHTITEV
jgi:hypothetical protein